MSKITVTTIAGATSGADANKVKIESGDTFHVPGHAAVGADVVDATRALTVVGATDGTGSSIIVGYNSSLASKFSVRDDGYVNVGNGLNLADGNLSVASGHGIDFSAGGNAAGMTSELLDDYEEGTWTPTYTGSSGNPTITYDALTEGSYTKIGRKVFIIGRIRTDACSGGGGTLQVSGLPFTVNNNYTSGGGVVSNDFGSNQPHSTMTAPNSTSLYLVYGNYSLNATSHLQNGTNKNQIQFSMFYTTNA